MTGPSRKLKPSRIVQFCQRSSLPSRLKDTPSGWVISSGLRSVRSGDPGEARVVLAGHLGEAVVVVVLDVEHLEGVHVDDDLETGHRVRVRVAARRRPHPDVAPAEPAITPLLGHHLLAVGPHVEQDQRGVADPASGQRREHLGVLVQGVVDVVVLVDGEVRADAGHVGPGDDRVGHQVDHGLVGLVGRLLPQHRQAIGVAPGRRVVHALTSAFGGSASSIEANRQACDTPWSRRRMAAVLPELVLGERIERMRHRTLSTDHRKDHQKKAIVSITQVLRQWHRPSSMCQQNFDKRHDVNIMLTHDI